MLFHNCCTILSSLQLITPSLTPLNNSPTPILKTPTPIINSIQDTSWLSWLPSLNYQLISNNTINTINRKPNSLISSELTALPEINNQAENNFCPAVKPESIQYSQVKPLGKPYWPVAAINTLPIDNPSVNSTETGDIFRNFQTVLNNQNFSSLIPTESSNSKFVATIADYKKNNTNQATLVGFNLKSNNQNYQNNLVQVRINNSFIALLGDRQQAIYMEKQLNQIFQDTAQINPNQIQPTMVNGVPGGRIGDRLIFLVSPELGLKLNQNPELLAIQWTNNIRQVLGFGPLSLDQGQINMYGLTETSKTFKGLASWYGSDFHGRRTANGETYNQFDLTVAHKTLPFNTYLKVTNPDNGKSVIVRVNDRGPYIPPRSLDLSAVAARCLGSEVRGVIKYEATILQ